MNDRSEMVISSLIALLPATGQCVRVLSQSVCECLVVNLESVGVCVCECLVVKLECV